VHSTISWLLDGFAGSIPTKKSTTTQGSITSGLCSTIVYDKEMLKTLSLYDNKPMSSLCYNRRMNLPQSNEQSYQSNQLFFGSFEP
jgi:hypothetical protein